MLRNFGPVHTKNPVKTLTLEEENVTCYHVADHQRIRVLGPCLHMAARLLKWRQHLHPQTRDTQYTARSLDHAASRRRRSMQRRPSLQAM